MNYLVRIWLKAVLLDDNINTWKTREPGGLPSFFGGVCPGGAYLATTGAKHSLNPPDERKEGVANVCYIF